MWTSVYVPVSNYCKYFLKNYTSWIFFSLSTVENKVVVVVVVACWSWRERTLLLTSLMKQGHKHSNFRWDSYKPAPALSRFRRPRGPEIEPCCSRACAPTSRWNYHGERSDWHCFFVDKNIAVNAHGILKEYAWRWPFLYFFARRGRFAWSFTMMLVLPMLRSVFRGLYKSPRSQAVNHCSHCF